jgi:hypothetical protein
MYEAMLIIVVPYPSLANLGKDYRYMPELNSALSSGLSKHLQEYSQRTKQPVAHIVSKVLVGFAS